MDRAFMTGVLLMTSFWQACAAIQQPAVHAHKASAAQRKAKHGAAQSSNSQLEIRNSLVAAELLDSLSYLQFCRMRLTAYNSLLKALLTAVSTSSQVLLTLHATAWTDCGVCLLHWPSATRLDAHVLNKLCLLPHAHFGPYHPILHTATFVRVQALCCCCTTCCVSAHILLVIHSLMSSLSIYVSWCAE